MIYLVTILGILLAIAVMSAVYEKQDIIKMAVFGTTSYLLVYILNAAVLFWINIFSVNRTCLLVMAEMAVVLVGLWICHKKPAVTFSYKRSLIPILLFLLALPVIWQKFGFFGMGQDEGVYQTKAIALIEGYNQNELELEETRTMSEEEKDQYLQGIAQQYGFYYTEAESPEITTGVFHGINTYPAVLAWWGTMFGYQNMSGVNVLLFFCALVLIYELALLFRLSLLGSSVVTMLYAISPIVLWVNKSTLSENVTAIVFLAFLYLLLDTQNQNRAWMSALPVAVFAVLHVSIYVMMPMFVCTFLIMYLIYKNRQYLVANILIAVAYKLGYLMMMSTAREYTESNYSFIERLGVNMDKMPMYSTAAAAVVVILSVILMFIPRNQESDWCVFDLKWFQIVLNWVIRLGVLFCAYYAYKTIKHSLFSYVNSTMYAYVWATALVVIPFILAVIYLRPKFIYMGKQLIPLCFIYLYSGIIYPTVLSTTVNYYNYYSRYITVYLACVLIFGACLFEAVIFRSGKQNGQIVVTSVRTYVMRSIYAVTAILAVVLYVRYDIFMIHNQDETRVQWALVEGVTEQMTAQDALIIDGDLKNQLFYTSKLISGNKSYPVMESLENTLQIAERTSERIYYVSNQQLTDEYMQNHGISLVQIYEDRNEIYDKTIADLGHSPYIRQAYVYDQKVFLYQYQ